VPTLTRPLLNDILKNDALTRGLGDAEARVLVEWIVERAEVLAEDSPTEDSFNQKLRKLFTRCRAIGRFVMLWGQPALRGGAAQLAAAERFNWPFPPPSAEPYEIMLGILVWEDENSPAR
jgi:hypothetical protein